MKKLKKKNELNKSVCQKTTKNHSLNRANSAGVQVVAVLAMLWVHFQSIRDKVGKDERKKETDIRRVSKTSTTLSCRITRPPWLQIIRIK